MSYWRFWCPCPQSQKDIHRPGRTGGKPQAPSAESLGTPSLGWHSPSLTGAFFVDSQWVQSVSSALPVALTEGELA